MNENYTIIIESALRGEQRGYEALYSMTKQSAYFIALNISKDEQDAMDILQNSYIKAFGSLKTLKEPEKFPNWFNRIVANESKTYIKKKKPMLFSDIENDIILDNEEIIISNSYTPQELVDNAESNRMIMEIINKLDEDKRLVILMHYYQEMTVNEIAEALSMPVTTVKYKLLAGRKDIKRAVEELESRGTKLYAISPLAILPIILMHCAEKSAPAPAFSEVQATILSKASAYANSLNQNNAYNPNINTNNTPSLISNATSVKTGFLSTLAGKIALTISCIVAVCLIIGAIVAGLNISNNENTNVPVNNNNSEASSAFTDEDENNEEDVENDDSSSENTNTVGTIDVPKITILGENYEFPMTFNEFASRGWKCIETSSYEVADLRELDNSYIQPNTSYWIYFSNGDLECIRFRLSNDTNELRLFKDCMVVGIQVDNESHTVHNTGYGTDSLNLLNVPDGSIVIADDIIPFQSTFDEAFAKFGTEYTTETLGLDKSNKLMYNFDGEPLSLDNHLFIYFDDNYVINGFMFDIMNKDAIK